ncbi:hypothetical protein PFISCL1PPCAC_23757, partial [Pristionchus fissidentatus]
MRFLVALSAIAAVSVAIHYTAPEKCPFFDAASTAANHEAGTDVTERIDACNAIQGCKWFLQNVMVKGNNDEERWAALQIALNSVEVQDFVKSIKLATTMAPIETTTTDIEE